LIDIRITLDQEGSLFTLKAEGHSMSAGKGSNIVCAAVSAQLRSVVRALKACSRADAEVSTDKPGFLELAVGPHADGKLWLKGVTDVLLAGLLETERDFPDECSIKLFKKN
jgi:uncharacterized protein YsxB (DUF464 family)